MAHDQDRRARGEPMTHSDQDLVLTQTAVTQAGSDPKPEAAAYGLAALPTEPAPPPPEPIASAVAPDRMLLHPGSTLKHYEILRELGEGGMGTVFLARDTKLGRLVAIKILLKHTGQSAARFLAEAQSTARCKHENIVVIYEVDEVHHCPYMVLEYLEGRTLRDWMTQRSPPGALELPAVTDPPSGLVSPSLAVELVLPVVRALACAHPLGIVHRDLKP